MVSSACFSLQTEYTELGGFDWWIECMAEFWSIVFYKGFEYSWKKGKKHEMQ